MSDHKVSTEDFVHEVSAEDFFTMGDEIGINHYPFGCVLNRIGPGNVIVQSIMIRSTKDARAIITSLESMISAFGEHQEDA